MRGQTDMVKLTGAFMQFFIMSVPKKYFFFFTIPVCAITTSGVPSGTLVSMNHFSSLCG
jgi:hypothetical protein